MRISGGVYAGRIIKGSPGTHVRPTTDRARESFFNIIQNKYDFSELTVLDLFAGTGIIALEFLSRGCADITSIDLNVKSIEFMTKLRNEFGLKDNWKIMKGNAMTFIQNNDLSAYDIIYADPPYNWGYYKELLNKIIEKLSEKTLFCLEHDRNLLLPHSTLKDEKSYGQSVISFYQR
ncbi:MAG: 16S rRNA (guanine(966)-N(2))-methyltransferase RsmD [Bacteroidetes bacterium]|nr:16S rRNA (guanine(966)-N(2))-methyltransferase RsmD [Bacteroidota bacterium]